MLSFSRRRQSSHTLYTSGKWHEKAGSATPEISLNLKQLQEEVPIEAMAVLVRQMVHLWQEKFGTSSRKGYYNREWADKMEEVGLIPTKTGLPGGKRTGQTVKHFVQSGGRFEQVYREMPKHCLSPFRPTIHEVEEKTGARNKVMYRCPGCGTKVWGKGGLGLICECGKVFVDDRSESKPGVIEEVCRVLVLQCR
jgi:predicted SprT family Zn-dependent metalloprotease